MLSAAYGYKPMTTFTTGNSMSVAEFQYQYCKCLNILKIKLSRSIVKKLQIFWYLFMQTTTPIWSPSAVPAV